MVATGNARAKRKNDSSITDTKIEPVLKALKKNDIILQFQALHQKFEALEEQNKNLLQENKNHIEAIILLEETVKLLENKSSNVELKSVTVQTEIIRCEECEFPAEDVNDLVYHMYEFHPLQGNEKGMECHYCDDKFESKRDLMFHRKQAHIEKVQFCVHFNDGKCAFGDTCWFSHDASSKKSCQEYKCSICEKEFKIKSVFMYHRKTEHSETVPICKHEITGSCQYGFQNCWFNHNKAQIDENESINENINENNFMKNNQNNEIMQKLVEMVEKYTQRIVQLENMLVKQ